MSNMRDARLLVEISISVGVLISLLFISNSFFFFKYRWRGLEFSTYMKYQSEPSDVDIGAKNQVQTLFEISSRFANLLNSYIHDKTRA